MVLDHDTVLRYYEEIFNLMNFQIKILNSMMDICSKKTKANAKQLLKDLKQIVISVKKLLNYNIKNIDSMEQDEIGIEICNLIIESSNKTFDTLSYLIAYIVRTYPEKNFIEIFGEDTSKFLELTEDELLDNAINRIKESVELLGKVLNSLDTIK